MTKLKRTNIYLQNTIQKNKDWTTRTPQNTGGEFRCYRRVSPTSGTHHVTLDKKKSNDKSWMKIGRDL